MIYLFKYIGKVANISTYVAAITSIRGGINGQKNQCMMRYKLFTNMQQGHQPFLVWWIKVREQGSKCTFKNCNAEKAV